MLSLPLCFASKDRTKGESLRKIPGPGSLIYVADARVREATIEVAPVDVLQVLQAKRFAVLGELNGLKVELPLLWVLTLTDM